MIQKTTKIICDDCSQDIYDMIGNSPREFTKFIKKQGWVVKYINGDIKDFCDEKCYEECKIS